MVAVILVAAQVVLLCIALRAVALKASSPVVSMLILSVLLVGALGLEFDREAGYPASAVIVLFSGAFTFGVVCAAWYRGPVRVSRIAPAAGSSARSLHADSLVCLLSTLLFAAVALIFFASNGVPLFASDADLARREAQQGNVVFYRVFLYAMPFTAVIALGNWYLRRALVPFLVALTAILTTIMTLTLLGFKGSVLWFAVWVLLFGALYAPSLRDTIGKAILFIGLGAVSGVAVTALAYGIDPLDGVFFLLDRATRIASTGLVVLVHDYLPTVDPARPVPDSFPAYFALWMFGRDSILYQYGFEITLSAPGGALLYLGAGGALVAAFVAGAMSYGLNHLAYQLRKDPLVAMLALYPSYLVIGWISRGYVSGFWFLPLSSLLIFGVCYVIARAMFSGEWKIYLPIEKSGIV